MLDWLWSRSEGLKVDSRGRPLQGKSRVVEAGRATSRFVVSLILAAALGAAVLVAAIGSLVQLHAIIGTIPAPFGLVVVGLYVGLALTLMVELSRGESLRKQFIDWTQIPLVKECLACGYGLQQVPRAPDGCVVCPECGAAWRETSEEYLQPLWHFRSKGLVRDRAGQAVALLRDISDDALLGKLGLPGAATTRTLRVTCIAIFLASAMLSFVASGLRSEFLVMSCGLTAMLAMMTGSGVLAQRTWAVRARVRSMLAQEKCPHCEHGVARDGRHRRCEMCGCLW